jgi:excisionase family DNA binding protein
VVELLTSIRAPTVASHRVDALTDVVEEHRGDVAATNHAVERPCPPDPILLTIPDAARMLALGRTTVYELIGSGALEVVHVGRSVRVPVDAVHLFVASKRAAR